MKKAPPDVDRPRSTQDEPKGASRREFVGSFSALLALLTSGPTANAEARGEASADASAASATGRRKEWHELPDLFAMVYLVIMRDWLRSANLYDTEEPPLPPRSGDIPVDVLHARTLDGTWNDLAYPTMGAAGRRFGRNIPLAYTNPDPSILDPNPRTISLALMTRHQFKPATSINILAAAWIQFQVHDWFAHEQGNASSPHRVPLPSGDSWPHGDPMSIPRTPVDTAPCGSTRPPAYKNTVPHWWDGSQLYGCDKVTNDAVRTGSGGKIRVKKSGLLEVDPTTGAEITGFMPNGWFGISMLHGVFALEHNAICDRLASKYPKLSDDELYHKARLVIAALLAKIHTLEWTLAALQTNVLKAAMHTNWHGLLGELQRISEAFQDSELLGGIVGSPTNHDTAPYSMTEEFVAVYRMHPLMPDDFTFFSASDGSKIDAYELPGVAGAQGRRLLEKYETRLEDLYYSIGVEHPGAITLQNYPRHLQDLTLGGGEHVDLATIELLRDRERGVPRYNTLRHLLGKRPIAQFSDLTHDGALARTLEEVYGSVDRIDAVVGLLAETPPERFAFSETAFRVFILMASRRLRSDRFYTKPYWSKDTYTKEGLEWIEENSMATVLRRHFPKLRSRIPKKANAFLPWKRVSK